MGNSKIPIPENSNPKWELGASDITSFNPPTEMSKNDVLEYVNKFRKHWGISNHYIEMSEEKLLERMIKNRMK